MAITSTGYDGSIDEADWADMIPKVGFSHYGVTEPSDWRVTAHATLARGVSISTGTGWGQGVIDTSDTTVSLQGATISSGSRWDMVVVRRNWSGTAGSTTFAMITGTSTKKLPARNNNPGSLDDQPLALVQFTAGSSAATSIVDLRCWARNGGITAKDTLALDYMAKAGSKVTILGTHWGREIDANDSTKWAAQYVKGAIPAFGVGNSLTGGVSVSKPFLVQGGSTVQSTDASGYARVTFPNPFPNGLLTVLAMNGDDYAVPRAVVAGAGGTALGTGSKTSWAYRLQNADGGVYASRNHRLNWIAIGW
jgi:hypothetical protein